MSLKDYKITQNDIETKGVVAAPDVMSGDPQTNKAIFDRLIREAVAEKVNGLVDALLSSGVEVTLKRGDDSIQYIRLNDDNVLEVSADGKEYFSTVGSGHIIVDKYGKDVPKGIRLQFDNFEVREEDGTIIVHGVAEEIAGAIPNTDKGAPNGVAELDGAGKVIQPQQWQSNPNLLHNWYFGNPVNQRGQTEYSGEKEYTVDKWYVSRGSLYVQNNSVRFVSDTVGNYKWFVQNTGITKTKGMIVTLSALMIINSCRGRAQLRLADGTTGLGIGGELPAATDDYELFQFSGIISEDCVKGLSVNIYASNSIDDHLDIDIKSVKLEIGTQQTHAHRDADGKWVLNEIPDYGEQLALCQRHAVAYKFTNGGSYWPCVAATATQAYCCITLPQNIRSVPAIVMDPSGFALRGEGVNHPVSSISVYSATSNMVNLLINTEGLTAGKTYVLRSTAEGKLIISIDL